MRSLRDLIAQESCERLFQQPAAVAEDPGPHDKRAAKGALSLRFGLGWSKSHSFHTGQTPTLRYNRQLMQAIWHGRLQIADIVNAQVIPLEDAPKG